MVNKVILIGNVGIDPEVRTLEGGAKVARIRLATTERLFDRQANETKEHTEWHTITLWRGLADVVDRFVRKGSQIYIEGPAHPRVDGQGQQQTLYDGDSGRYDEFAGPSQRQSGFGRRSGPWPTVRSRAVTSRAAAISKAEVISRGTISSLLRLPSLRLRHLRLLCSGGRSGRPAVLIRKRLFPRIPIVRGCCPFVFRKRQAGANVKFSAN